MMRRRGMIWALAVGILTAPVPIAAQPTDRAPGIGFLVPGSASSFAHRLEGFRRGLRDLGYFEKQNVAIEPRFAEGRAERFPELAAQLVRRKVAIIVTMGTPAALAAKRSTSTIPIVMANVGDAVGLGLVASLARPGGNITGSSDEVIQ